MRGSIIGAAEEGGKIRMKVLLIYYTGTYNTRYLTDKVEAEFVRRGHEVDRVEINCDTPVKDVSEYDLLGFGYPIYGFNSPLPFNRYTKKLNVRAGQAFFIYKNSGETLAMNNASSRILLRRMQRKGAVLKGEYHFVMPYNIHFPFEKDFVREILDYDNKLLRIMMYRLEHGIVQRIESNLLYDAAAAAVGIQKAGGAINSFLYRVDEEKCIQCGLCVKNCPEKNIRFEEGRVKFGHRCDMCMRCSFYCPQDAVRIGFLEGWRVNGDYGLRALDEAGPPEKPYITENSRGFYKCYIKYFAKIDEEYEKLFGFGCGEMCGFEDAPEEERAAW